MYDPNVDLIFYIAVLFFLCGLILLGWFVVLPVRRLVRQLEHFAKGRKDLGELKYRNEAELLGLVFKLLTTELKSKEDELQRLYEQAAARAQFMERYSERLVENIPVGVVALTHLGRVTTLNSAAERMFGIRMADIAGKPYASLWGADTHLTRRVQKSLESVDPLGQVEVLWRGSDGAGDPRFFQVIGTNLQEGPGNRETVHVFTLYDLTPLRQLEEKIRTTERLAAIGSLTAGLAHEIRNPLSAILGYSNLLLKKAEPDPELRELAGTVEKEAKDLNRVVNEFLEFVRSHEASASYLRYRDIVEEVINRLARTLKERNAGIEYRGFPEEGLCALDKPSLHQVLYNLLLNAVQASPDGGKVELVYEDLDLQGMIRLTVKDAGEGIPSDQRGKIFDPFFTTKSDGMGLGLSIVHRIVTSTGGEVSVDSGAGRGSLFTVTIPKPIEATQG